ncbi:hypothetical protein KIN34_14265 [Cellulomonas sp. DKR-3]|uniref:ANTAR domain-containing protein n=1 Tax=Cellulomonas fulva TaxID=2835530 RepID=A0ABS5U220_9CELL|nr:hypothetical protein [Cellulomonas fulva]MBT0995448.1 hypothetical protein [Cellulomonas fulva]
MPIRNLPTPRQATGAVAGLYSHGAVPDPSTLDAARATLATATLDKAIRDSIARTGTALNDAQVGHLVGLLLAESGVPAVAVAKVEHMARVAVARAHGWTP